MPSMTILKDALLMETRLNQFFFVFKEHLAMKWENFTGTISASWQIRKIVACTYVARLFFSSLKPGAPHGQIEWCS